MLFANIQLITLSKFYQKTLRKIFKNYIFCSIGPVSNTLVDFWQLIWQEKLSIIVMINVIEEGKVKCQQYWPDSDTKDYGPFSVTLSDEQVLTDYTVRKMYIKVKKTIRMSGILS